MYFIWKERAHESFRRQRPRSRLHRTEYKTQELSLTVGFILLWGNLNSHMINIQVAAPSSSRDRVQDGGRKSQDVMSTSALLPSSGRLSALFPVLFYPPDGFVFLGHYMHLYIFIITQPDAVKSVILTLKPATFLLKSCILDIIRRKASVQSLQIAVGVMSF